VTPLALIDAIPVFATLTSDEKQRLAETATVREFRKGDVIVQEGEMLPALMMVRAGIIAARHAGEERGRLAPGDFFGETGLLAGMQEVCTLEALTSVITYEIDQEAFAPLLAERPALAEEIAEQLAGRAERFRDGAALRPEQAHSAHAILKTIRTIFRA
jgi:CRP-like cAMP-binding protein